MSTAENPIDLADTIAGHYCKHGRDWDADRRALAWNDKPWHERFVAALPRRAAVLDLGCGGGSPVAVNLVENGVHVTGVDASEPLVSLCRERMPSQQWIVGDMRTLALDRSFDGILAWDSFFHLKPSDQRGMFGIFAAHAAPATMLMFNTGTSRGESIGCYRGDPLYHASLDTSDYATLLDRAGFKVMAHSVEDPHAGGRTVWLARSRY